MGAIEYINSAKANFEKVWLELDYELQKEIGDFYNTYSTNGFAIRAKRKAEDIIDYADRNGYGYGEVGYNLNEEAKDFSEDFAEEAPELGKAYKKLLVAYFDLLVEAKEA